MTIFMSCALYFLYIFFCRTWKKLPKIDNLPNIGLETVTLSPNVTYIRWKVHGDWVTQVLKERRLARQTNTQYVIIDNVGLYSLSLLG